MKIVYIKLSTYDGFLNAKFTNINHKAYQIIWKLKSYILKHSIQQNIYMLCFKQETNQAWLAENRNQESWVENQPQDGIDSFFDLKLANLKSCTQYQAKAELKFNNEPVKDSINGDPISNITTPEFLTQPDTSILPTLTLINPIEDSANFKLTGLLKIIHIFTVF
jgi:hypothetical protein